MVATVSSGARYQGLLAAADALGALSVVLHKPQLISKAVLNEKSNSDSNLPERLVIQAKDLIDIEVKEYKPSEPVEAKAETKVEPKVDPKPEVKAEVKPKEVATKPEVKAEPKIEVNAEPKAEQKFRTDSDISSSYQVRERVLQRWVPDESTPALTLEDDSNGTWDQFKVNEEKFGVESTYDEHLYTTRINKNTKDYQERLQRAERLAREIEGLSSSDRHVLEERGVTVDDSGFDEEDKYSGVQNGNDVSEAAVDTRGNELMAALRNASISSESVPPTEGRYATPRQRAAQYHNDPAIVSSSATKVQLPEEKLPVKPTFIPAKPQVAASQTPAQHNELFRLNAQSEINALREFSASFKVPHKMPNDLLPILAKDKLKQDEILRKQDVKKPQEVKKENKFKLNPNAASFTPSLKPATIISPVPPKAAFAATPSASQSPRLHSLRPFSTASTTGSAKRHHQISASDFFGGADKVPTKESQNAKTTKLRGSFAMFVTAQAKYAASGDKSRPLVLEKAFYTTPTWASTVDESYEKLIALQTSGSSRPMMPSPGMPVPLMQGASPQMGGGGFPGNANTKFPISQHMQSQQQASMAAHFQQQQMHAAMLYQQFQGGMPPGQPLMYAPPGVDPQFLPPGGFMVPGFNGSPVSGNMVMGNGSPYAGNMNMQGNYNNHQGRRYNNQKRGN